MKNLHTEVKLPSHIQPVAEPGIISISGVLAQYCTQLAVLPLSFDYSLCLLTVSWVSGLEAGPEGKAQDSTVTGPLHRIVQWPRAQALSPGRGSCTRTTATAPLSTALHRWLLGQIQP